MFVIGRGESRWVLRRPTAVALERANDGMHREFRILSALAGSAVPHPAAVALCPDARLLGSVFYLMAYVDGEYPMPPPALLDNQSCHAEISNAMVDALAELHAFDWRAAGLADLGRPEQFHERQATRWTRQLASYAGRELPGFKEVADWLTAHRPQVFVPGLMHGDFHMRNALIAPDPPARVLAVLDWETATIGDPLLDLAGFLEVWCPATDASWPGREALIDRYRVTRGIEEVPDLRYYEVLYHFRLAVLVEGIYQRSLHDPARPVQEDSGRRAIVNITRAKDLAGR